MGTYYSRHQERDMELPQFRQQLLKAAQDDLLQDLNVLSIYLGGSLARGNFDNYSDIDLRVLVKPETHQRFVSDKLNRPKRWGNVLFFEDLGPKVTHTVAHYDCFVKIDIFYINPEDLRPSLWLQDTKILYDPQGIVQKVYDESLKITYSLSVDEYEKWRGKVLAYLHEVYRRVMRKEISYAFKMLNGLAGFAVQGWHMEAGRFPNLWADWSKMEGRSSRLADWQLSLLDAWHCERDENKIMSTMASMIPELLRLNQRISRELDVAEKREVWEQAVGMVL